MEQTTDRKTHYETLYVIHPVHGSKNKELKDRFQGVLESQGAEITHFEEWGLRDLAYPVQKQGKGYYNLIQFLASSGTTEELERVMRLTEEVMRSLTVALDEDVRPIVVERPAEPKRADEETQSATASGAGAAAEGPEAEPETPATQESTDPAQT
jgi:small subunit ribosomal protein S6